MARTMFQSSLMRRGGSTLGLLSMLAIFGGMGVTAVILGPRILQAQSDSPSDSDPEVLAARDPAHQQTLELVAKILARSRAVLALHHRGQSPFEEIVLWIEDRDNPGILDVHELAIISHSKVMQTITYYSREADPARGEISLDEAGKPGFCHRWRTDPAVTSRVIAAGISDVELIRQPMIQAGKAALRISFTWVSETVDGPDEASALVAVLEMN